jgi:hypothetical protein
MSYACPMAITIPPDLEQRVTRRARELDRDPVDVLTELLERALEADEYRQRLERIAEDQDAALEGGKVTLSPAWTEEIRRRMHDPDEDAGAVDWSDLRAELLAP